MGDRPHDDGHTERLQMNFDDVAWEASEKAERAWREAVVRKPALVAIGDFIKEVYGGVATELCDPKGGTFNGQFRMKFQGGHSAVIRLPKHGVTMFPEEKVRNEAALMRLIQDQTTIPVPFILRSGKAEESPQQLGPFIVMEYVEHDTDMGQALNDPTLGIDDRPMLNPGIDTARLSDLYRQIAGVLLEFSLLEFAAIGSPERKDEFSWEVKRRPLSMSMNELVRLGTLPRDKLPKSVFKSSSRYFQALAELHIEHLAHQRNDAVQGRIDCQRKYVARHLFLQLARQGKLTMDAHDNGPFKMWCDDLRPSNILLAGGKIAAVIDWEFAYAAPREFSIAPPWWLLLEHPELWPGGLDEWTDLYQDRLDTFLEAMRECEDSAIASGRLREDQRLSCEMRHSWDTGDFWVVYAARKSFAFDAIFWHKLYPRFFGPCGTPEGAWRDALALLSADDRDAMAPFVDRKMAEMETRVLAWEPDEAV